MSDKKNITNQDSFIKKAIEIHGERYDYSKVVYMGMKKKVCIVCKKHGDFFQCPSEHIYCKNGCQRCGVEKVSAAKFYDTEKFIKLAKEIHGDRYDYSNVKYKRSNEKVEIVCKKHGIFYQSPNKHLGGRGCKWCAGEKLRKINTENGKQRFYEKIKENEDVFDYSCVEYKSNDTKVEVICKKCNRHFFVLPANLMKGSGCPWCKRSKGEIFVERFLKQNSILYEKEKTFKGLKDIQALRFDFFLPEKNIVIEYQGNQHYEFPNPFHKSLNEFEALKRHDQMKRDFCKEKLGILQDEEINMKLVKLSLGVNYQSMRSRNNGFNGN